MFEAIAAKQHLMGSFSGKIRSPNPIDSSAPAPVMTHDSAVGGDVTISPGFLDTSDGDVANPYLILVHPTLMSENVLVFH